MKYERIGAQEFVPYPYDDVTLDLIKKACYDHYKQHLIDPLNSTCDILASQNGPSCSKLSHIKNFKLIFFRFISGKPSLAPTSMSTLAYLKRGRNSSRASSFSTTASSTALKTTKKTGTENLHQSSIYPKSISVTTMLKIGSPISYHIPTTTSIKLLEFDVANLEWNSLHLTKDFIIESTPFAKGGFRSVCKARFSDNNELFVVKRFLPETLTAMDRVNEMIEREETNETLARKAIQTHMLSLNFAEQLALFVRNTCVKEFGETFQYQKAYFGIIDKDKENKEHVMVEKFIPGNFSKYMNNNGIPSQENESNLVFIEKAMCLSHYSYEKSNKKLLLVDIQGSGYALYDPEIATTENAIDENGGLRFCMGNLSTQAFENFVSLHKCNKFCDLVGLKPLQEKETSL